MAASQAGFSRQQGKREEWAAGHSAEQAHLLLPLHITPQDLVAVTASAGLQQGSDKYNKCQPHFFVVVTASAGLQQGVTSTR